MSATGPQNLTPVPPTRRQTSCARNPGSVFWGLCRYISFLRAVVTVWDPSRYLEFADERSRPFVDLLNRVDVAEPTVVVDLGCGPGQLTASLADRWPNAQIVGLDSSLGDDQESCSAHGPANEIPAPGSARLAARDKCGRNHQQRHISVGSRAPHCWRPSSPGSPLTDGWRFKCRETSMSQAIVCSAS